MCQAIASPSRSGSVARYTRSAFFPAMRSSFTIFRLLGSTSYCGRKSSSTFTPSEFSGRSLTWPMEERTSNSRPRTLLMVRAFAGDSTITSERGMVTPESRFGRSALRVLSARKIRGYNLSDNRRRTGGRQVSVVKATLFCLSSDVGDPACRGPCGNRRHGTVISEIRAARAYSPRPTRLARSRVLS
ncbi:MAG: hypothetical protein BWY06_02538 [Candidatus Latescibacteria bacterium ADurb.Bin168]|nr:MAG: hypothetical protein BWY06_02538 [Candidatus Latescibacteria bacterium ADurb.Bin168]